MGFFKFFYKDVFKIYSPDTEQVILGDTKTWENSKIDVLLMISEELF